MGFVYILDLIHMNGRIYDYQSGRFLSVDPFISMPGSSQAYNPYSYVMNNPLSYTDPTGYIPQVPNRPPVVGGMTGEGVSGASFLFGGDVTANSRRTNNLIQNSIIDSLFFEALGTIVISSDNGAGKNTSTNGGGHAQTGNPTPNTGASSSGSPAAIPSLPAPCTGECVAEGISLANMPAMQSSAAKRADIVKLRKTPKPPKTRGFASIQALAILFGNDVHNVRLNKDGRADTLGVLATTDVNQIWFSPTSSNCSGCSYSSFFGEDGRSLDFTVLEEYFHVIRQWNTGNMSMTSYLWESTWNGYDNNKYELEAKGFARDNLAKYRQLIRQQQ